MGRRKKYSAKFKARVVKWTPNFGQSVKVKKNQQEGSYEEKT